MTKKLEELLNLPEVKEAIDKAELDSPCRRLVGFSVGASVRSGIDFKI